MARAGESRLRLSGLRARPLTISAEGKSYVLPPVNAPRWRARFQKSADAPPRPLCAKSAHCAVHSMTSSASAIKPGERRSPCIGSRLDNSEKVQPALDADTQAAFTHAIRIQRNLRHRYHHKNKI